MVGYNVTAVDGATLILNPIARLGPLTSTFHRPTVSLAVDLSKNWTYKSSWGYYDYNEPTEIAVDPTIVARKFHGNIVYMSLKYVF